MPHPVFTPGNTALITGAASGVGLAIAHLCLSHSMNLLLLDTNAQNLGVASGTLRSSIPASTSSNDNEKPRVETYVMDVSKPEEWKDMVKWMGDRGFSKGVEEVDLLVLNAGVGGEGTWGDDGYFERILGTNLGGVVNGLNACVPGLKKADQEGKKRAVVITGSKQGITNPPFNPAYNASKAAVKALAEQLSWDLRGTGVSVHLLVPGWTFTGLSGGHPGSTAPKPDGAWWPAQVADYMFEKMGQDKFYILCPDNDVTEDKDKRRMLWAVGDIVNERPPLTRWRDEYKEEAEKWMKEQQI